MQAKLDGLELVFLQHVKDDPSGPLQDLRSILKVWTSDRRAIVEHKVPGKEASVLQDLGRHSLRFAFVGEFIGPKAKTTTETLWQKFHQGKALPFSSDIVALSEVKKVVIEQLEFEDLAGKVTQFRYRLVLREYKDPPKAKGKAPSQAKKAEKKAKEETNKAAGSVNYVTGKVLDSEKKPVKDARVVVKGDQGDFELRTDENGVFRRDNLDPGKYEVKVDAPGYEDEKREVEIKPAETGGGTETGGTAETEGAETTE